MRPIALAAVVAILGACSGPQVSVGPQPEIETVDPQSYESFLRARLLADLRYWEEAADALRTAIAHDPQSPSLHLELAATLTAVVDGLEEGLLACDLASDLGADPADVLLARTGLLAQHDDVEGALEAFRLSVSTAVRPDVFGAWIALAQESAGDPVGAAGLRAQVRVLQRGARPFRRDRLGGRGDTRRRRAGRR